MKFVVSKASDEKLLDGETIIIKNITSAFNYFVVTSL